MQFKSLHKIKWPWKTRKYASFDKYWRNQSNIHPKSKLQTTLTLNQFFHEIDLTMEVKIENFSYEKFKYLNVSTTKVASCSDHWSSQRTHSTENDIWPPFGFKVGNFLIMKYVFHVVFRKTWHFSIILKNFQKMLHKQQSQNQTIISTVGCSYLANRIHSPFYQLSLMGWTGQEKAECDFKPFPT